MISFQRTVNLVYLGMSIVFIVLIAVAVTAVIVWMLAQAICKNSCNKEKSELEAALASEKALRANEKCEYEARLLHEREDHEKSISHLKEGYDNSIAAMKEGHKLALDAAKAQIALENENRLKQREESLKKEAAETFKTISDSIYKSMRDMKESFEAQKKAAVDSSASIRTKFDETVDNLRRQTESVGSQAEGLAKALRGQNKMQGVFGETVLENILHSEGLQKGRDYDAEEYLRDESGRIMDNEDSGRRMRPDFVLHFPDGTDILIDSKVSLTALSDYYDAGTDETRSDAARRNLDSVLKHVKELSAKSYQKYVKSAKTLDYVIMFIPNYGAYQLAKQENPNIFNEAFKQNVLITTEETLIPFVRLIRSAWVQKVQIDNMQGIVDAAGKMVDKVSDFCVANEKVKDALERTVKLFDENRKRLVEGRGSIVSTALRVVDMGAPLSHGKRLPSPMGVGDEDLQISED